MGKADYLKSFKERADQFVCTLLPGTSRPQIQYSPGTSEFADGSISTSKRYLFYCVEKKKRYISTILETNFVPAM